MSALDDHYATPVPPLFHYTDQRALISIWETGELWASAACYLNDSTEFYSGIALARRLLTQRMEVTLNHRTLFNLQEMHKYIIPLEERANVFVCCFCADGDLLSQWRGYAGGGSGYAIEFDGVALKLVADQKGLDLYKCVYEENEQEQLMSDLIDKYENVSIHPRQMGLPFIRPLSQLICVFKHEGFRAEQE